MVSFEHRTGTKDNAINIVTVAKVLPDKGIREITELAKLYPDYYFTIIGDTTRWEKPSLDKLMNTYPNLTFLGQKTQDDIKTYIQNCTSVLLHPSYHE
jgi:glycosyltransferase involved in cell wall biosynthesis